jgi:uncharacterized protein YacL
MNATSVNNWINANGVTIQVLAAIAIPSVQALWKKWKDSAMKTPPETKPQALQTSSSIWFLKNAWGFLIGLPLAAWMLNSLVSTPEPVTREFVGAAVLLGIFFMFNFLMLMAFLIAAAFRSVYLQIKSMGERLSQP